MASTSRIQLYSAQALTGDATSDTKSLEPNQKKFIAFMKVSAIGAGTSLAMIIQHSPNLIDWFTVATFAAATTTTAEQIFDSDFAEPNQGLFPNLRAVADFTGGATTGTVTVEMWFDPDKK